jgi:hypothetical protein
MPQPVSYNPGTPVSGSIQENSISYVVDGQNRNYRGGFGGLSWMSEVPAANNVIFIGNSVSLGRGPANIPLFYPSYNNSAANIIYAANTLPGSPRNFTTTGSAYNWAATNNFFINNSDNPIPRIDADGLAFYVDASQPTSYPQTGTTWYDMSGKGTNGTLQNGVNWVASSGSFFFDGTDDYVSLGNLGTIGDTQTIEVWFNSNSVTSYKNVLDMNYSTYNPNTGNVGPRLEQTSGAGINWIWSGNTTNNNIYNFTPQISISSNKWYHTVFTLNSGNWNWYLNGNLEYSGTSPQGYVTTYGDVNLGRGFVLDPARYFSGLESSARIYSRTLSTSDVKQNYFQSNIVTDGLIFMVDANNLVSYPKSGATSYSLTGSNTATLVNGVGYSSQNGGSFVFDGVDDYIQTNLNQNTDNALITWECWYFDDSPGGYVSSTALISNYGPSGTTPFTLLHVTTAGNVLFAQRNSVGAEASAVYSGNICDGRWHHVVGTVDSTNISMYIDGVYQSSNTKITGTTTSGQNIVIGSNHLDRYQSCRIANARLYNVALTPTQIQQNYQATKDKFLGENIITNGLVLNLDAANKDSYPGTGTTWTDLSGGGYNGTLQNGPTFLSNVNGGIFSFDGTDDYVTTSNTGMLTNGTGNFSYGVWVNFQGKPTFGTIFENGLYTAGILIRYYGPADGIQIYAQNAYYGVYSLTPSLNTWYYLSFVRNGNFLDFYVNGIYQTALGFTANIFYDPNLFIGTSQHATWQTFNGYIPVAQIYNRALSATEVLQNYNAQKTRFGL